MLSFVVFEMNFVSASHFLWIFRMCDASVSIWRLLDFYLVPPKSLAQLVIRFWDPVTYILSARSSVHFVSLRSPVLLVLHHLLSLLLTVQLWLLLVFWWFWWSWP